MRRLPARPRRRGLVTWLGYRLDRFLGLSPLVQLGSVLIVGFFAALLFGAAIHVAGGERGEVRTVGSGLWWAVTHMLDGGTLSANTSFVTRAFGLAVTLIGLVAVAVLTGALASSFGERVRAIRGGTLPILERGHILVLGWNARGGVMVRELAISGLYRTVVVLTDHAREVVEEQVRAQHEGLDHHVDVVVRRGDPTTVAALRLVAARRAEVVVILVDGDEATGDLADRAVLRSLLALRRVTGRRPPHTVVEVWSARGRELLGLCARAAQVVIVEARETSARLLAHSVRQPGAFEVVRQILSLDGRSIYAHRAGRFAGKTFDAAHAALEPGILIGVVREGRPVLSPPGDWNIEPGDQLLVFGNEGVRPESRGSLPEDDRRTKPACEPPPRRPLDLLVLGHKPELAVVLETLAEAAGAPARVTVLAREDQAEAARAALAVAAERGLRAEVVVGDPLGGAALDAALAAPHDVVLLLAPDVPSAAMAEADADQLITILHVLARDRAGARVVAEVRSPETPRLAAGRADVGGPADRVDYVLSRELVGMLLAQEVHLACLGDGRERGATPCEAAYQEIFDAIGAAIEVEPLSRYVAGHELPTFGHVLASARARGEVALGIIEDAGLAGAGAPATLRAVAASPYLLPRREERFEVTPEARVVVLSPEAASHRLARASEPASRKPDAIAAEAAS